MARWLWLDKVKDAASDKWFDFRQSRIGKGLHGTAKATLWAGGIAAGVAALGLWARSSREKRRYNPEPLALNAQAMPMMTPDMPAGPADGYAPGQWAATVQAQRGASGAEMNPRNPRMNVGEAEDLGSVRSI